MKPKKPFKILVISLSVGSGHIQAAKAIKEAIDSQPDSVCEHIDMAGYITRVFKASAVSSYHVMIEKFPKLWKTLFTITDNKNVLDAYYLITKYLKLVNSFSLYKKIQQFNPDHIICTHFLPADVLLNTTSTNKPRAPISTVITDYGLQSLWVVEGVSHYFAPTEEIKHILMQKHAIPASRITVSGIPVYQAFYKNKTKKELRTAYHIPQHQKVALLLSGGYGLTRVHTLTQKIFSYAHPLTLIVIAGKNTELKQELLKLSPPNHIQYRVIGWTNDMASYMRLSDVVISKPGGLTTTECMVSGTPLIAVDPIPGQEEFNVTFIQQKNLGALAKDTNTLLKLIHYFLENKSIQLPTHQKIASEIICETINPQKNKNFL